VIVYANKNRVLYDDYKIYLLRRLEVGAVCRISGGNNLSSSWKIGLMLTTLGFILAAYLTYAFFAIRTRRSERWGHTKKGSVWHTLASGSLVSLVIICGLVISPVEPEEKPRIAGFLGTVWAETRPAKVDDAWEYLQVNGREARSEPAYVFLNPGTPASLIKPPESKRLRKPRPLKKAIVLKKDILRKQNHSGPREEKLASR
jgi:hypothetical protein